MNRPSSVDVPDAPERVRLTRIVALDCWLMEFPAVHAPDWKTECWSAFLTNEQVRELGQAVLVALVLGARPAPDALTGQRTPREKMVRLISVPPSLGSSTAASSSADCRDDELPPSA